MEKLVHSSGITFATKSIVDARSQAAIDARVARLLKDLGNPKPPLDLDSVRELLRLDRHYYSLSDPSTLQGIIHNMRIGGRNLLAEPRRIWDVVKKLDLKALIVPARRQILLDSELPSPKQRWAEGHEITHSILDWHAPYCHGDRSRTISEGCHSIIEAEANYGSGRLLFLGDRFVEECRSAPLNMDRIGVLAKLYGNSKTSTLWRCVENALPPAAGMISAHPWTVYGAQPDSLIRHAFCSPEFTRRFSRVPAAEVFVQLAKVVRRRGGGLLGTNVVCLIDDHGDTHEFTAACFDNTHDVLSLLVHTRQVTARGV